MESEEKNYYDILGVAREASREEIRRAYRDIAQVYHPDSNFFSEIIEDKLNAIQVETFKLITAAYHTLMNEEARKRYDDTLAPSLRGWDTKTDLRVPRSRVEDILNETGAPQAPFAFGTFGVTGEDRKSAFENPEEVRRVRAVSEIIELKPSLKRRFLRFFGF